MRYLNYKRRQMIKRVLSAMLIFGLLLAIPATSENFLLNLWKGEIFFADPASIDDAQDELDRLEEQIDDWRDEFGDLEIELNEKAMLLSDLMADQEILENDITETQEAIDIAQMDLDEAKAKEAAEYAAMKIRIQYMYENGKTNTIWETILSANGLADMVNRVEYINQVHQSDRELLEQYKATVVEVETYKEELDSKMNDLLTLQEVYEHQEAELQTALAELQEEVDDYETQIAAAEARSKELADYIEEQNKKLEEESGGGTSGGYLDDPSYDPAYTSGVDPDELVAYALQFVGNPYVWGGNSLTEGCDCSGFVNLIYRHFGFTGVPRYSQDFKTYGKPVAFVNIKPGDIVVYPGHVAIYIGNGKIVEAQSSKAGITCNRKVKCSTITAIRRAL